MICALKQRKAKEGKKAMKVQRQSEYDEEIELQEPKEVHARDYSRLEKSDGYFSPR